MNARPIARPAMLVPALMLGTASMIAFAGPRGEGDHFERGRGHAMRSEGRESRPAPSQPVFTAPARAPQWQGGGASVAREPARPPVFAPTPREPGRAWNTNDADGWRHRQPVEPRRDGGRREEHWRPADSGGQNWVRDDHGRERHEWNDRHEWTDRRVWNDHRWSPPAWGHGGFGDRHFPHQGFVVDRLPEHCHTVVYRRDRFFFNDGVWFRPFGPRFVVAIPPIGLVVPLLPSVYATVWFGGVPYYYANDIYYRWSAPDEGYVVVERPDYAEDESTVVPADDIYMYPRNQQTSDEQAEDRYACHRWAVEQTGYDPSVNVKYSGDTRARRANYRRAMQACLNGRGYSVT